MRKFVVAVFLIVVICCMVLGTLFVTSAEVDSNAIYTYNQLVQNGNFSNGTTGFSAVGGSISAANNVLTFTYSSNPTSYFSNCFSTSYNFSLNHRYYARMSFSASKSCVVRFDVFNYGYGSFNYSDVDNFSTFDIIVSSSSVSSGDMFFGVNSGVFVSGDSVHWSNIFIIDLTLMFGSGNEPTIDECRSLFPSDYYVYNLGTPLTMNGVESYNNGYNDALSAYDYVVTSSFFSQTAYGIDFNGYRPAVTNRYNSDDFTNALRFSGYMVLPFGQTLASSVVLECSLVVFDVDNRFTSLDVGILYGGQYLMLYSIDNPNDDPADNSPVEFTITLPYASDGLVLFSNNSEGPSIQDTYSILVTDINVSYRYYNPQNDINNIYNSGFEAGYSDGSHAGYNKGYAAGLADGTNNDYTFLGLLSSVVQAPVTVLVGEFDSATGERVGGLLNFEFLGYNMSTLLMSLFSIGIVICVVRLFV